jgi:hypothetical protein
MVSTVGVEKATNPRLTKSKEEFKELMDGLNLPYPKKIGTFTYCRLSKHHITARAYLYHYKQAWSFAPSRCVFVFQNMP